MIGATKIALARAGMPIFNRRGAIAIIAEEPEIICVNVPGSEPFHPQKFGHDALFGFFHNMPFTYRH
jgi:hypothetical protein